jgi:uncharacterized protein (DUF885 family)
MSASFVATAEAIVDDVLRLRPELATALGEHAHDSRLDDLTRDGLAHERTALSAHRDALDSLDLDVLGPDEAVDADILRSALDCRLLDLEVVREHTWNPLVWLPGEALHPLLTRDTTPVAERLRALAERLWLVPDRLAAARATLEQMPLVHVETAVQQSTGVLALIHAEVSRLVATQPSLGAVVTPARAAAATAVEGHRDWLLEQLPHADRDPRLGADVFAAKLHLTLDAELGATAVVAAAERHLEHVTEQLEQVARDWVGRCEDPVREALARVAASAPDDTTIVGLAERALADATDAVRRLGLVSVPDEPCDVHVMPEFRRGVSVAYCDPPGPLEVGGTTQFAISPTPAGWSPERVASFYREYNAAMVTNLTVHEAMPGHVLQLAHARRHDGSTRVRRVFSSGSFVEGWAVHAERLMAEAGHGGVPVRLQQLKTQLRMTINALLDAGVHAGGMTEVEGLDLMQRRGHQEEGEAVGKWRRAQLTSAQLSTYFVGYRELSPVLADLPETSGPPYDQVLAHGSPPPRHLRALLAG